jgi:hypothetical protein
LEALQKQTTLKECKLCVNFTNILRAAFAPMFLRQKLQTLNISTKKLGAKLWYEKATRKFW